MAKKQIKKLALASYTGNVLDFKKTKKISGLLTRADLKQYIKELKLLENQKNVKILIPSVKKNVNKDIVRRFKKVFSGKNVIIEEDPSLILGVKIIDNDLIYDLSLRNTLDSLNTYINKQYD